MTTLDVLNFVIANMTTCSLTLGWYIPVGNGTTYITSTEYESYLITQPVDEKSLIFLLYTDENPYEGYPIPINDSAALAASPFKSDFPTFFFIHGWKGDSKTNETITARDAILKTGNKNVIVFDWGAVAANLNYVDVRAKLKELGQILARYLKFICDFHAKACDYFTLVGHSLGAHIAGYCGKAYIIIGKIILKILGLDPAGPLFEYCHCSERLCATDALYVETIHTNRYMKGVNYAIGHASFFPNDGGSQPGCGIEPLYECSHARAVFYYTECLKYDNYLSSEYESCENVGKNCSATYSTVRMGSMTNFNITGCYCVPVNSQSPYGVGPIR